VDASQEGGAHGASSRSARFGQEQPFDESIRNVNNRLLTLAARSASTADEVRLGHSVICGPPRRAPERLQRRALLKETPRDKSGTPFHRAGVEAVRVGKSVASKPTAKKHVPANH